MTETGREREVFLWVIYSPNGHHKPAGVTCIQVSHVDSSEVSTPAVFCSSSEHEQGANCEWSGWDLNRPIWTGLQASLQHNTNVSWALARPSYTVSVYIVHGYLFLHWSWRRALCKQQVLQLPLQHLHVRRRRLEGSYQGMAIFIHHCIGPQDLLPLNSSRSPGQDRCTLNLKLNAIKQLMDYLGEEKWAGSSF